MDGSTKSYSTSEVALHNKDGDCWLVIEGKVYNVSEYMGKHPGGADIMVENSSGKDATEEYENADHTKRAREMLAKYYIGDLAA